MAQQLQLRNGTATQVAAFTGAQAEVAVDTTNNRIVIQDGSTAGGFAAGLETSHSVADAAYTARITDRQVAYSSLTAARTVTLPAASAYPSGACLTVIDESGSCSTSLTITLARAGSDTINGATSLVLNAPYASAQIESNGTNGWVVLNTGGPSLMMRHAVADASYTALTTDRFIAYTSITTARTVTLCAASAFPTGTRLTVTDESGSCSAFNTIAVVRAGSDTISGSTGVTLNSAYASVELESNGSNAWTVVGSINNGLGPGLVGPSTTLVASLNGASMTITVMEQLVSGLSGASVIAGTQIPAGVLVLACSERVTTAITGATSFSIGYTGSTSAFGSSLSITAASTNEGMIGPLPVYSATNLILTAAGGNFTAGAVRLSLTYLTFTPPTS